MLFNFGKKTKNFFFINSLYLYLSHFADYLLSIFLLPLIAKTIGTTEFGIISLAQTFSLLIILFMEFGSSLMATREVARIKEDKSKVKIFIQDLTGFKIFLIPVVLIIAFLVAFNVPIFSSRPHYILIVALGAIFQGMTPTWYFQGIEKMKKISISKIFFRSISFLIIIFLVKSSKDGWIVLASFTLSSTLICIYLFYEIVKKIGPFNPFQFEQRKSIVKRSIPSFLITAIPLLYQNISIFMLSVFVNPFQLGLLFGASRIHRAFNTLYSPISQAFFPLISSINDKKKNESKKLIKEYSFFIGSIGLLFFLLNYFFTENLILLLLGHEFSKSEDLLRIFSILFPLTAISNALGRQWLMVIDKESYFSVIQMISAMIASFTLVFIFKSHGIGSYPISLIFYELSTVIMILLLLFYSNK